MFSTTLLQSMLFNARWANASGSLSGWWVEPPQKDTVVGTFPSRNRNKTLVKQHETTVQLRQKSSENLQCFGLDLKTLQLFDVAAIAVVGCPKLLQLLLKPIHCGDCGARNQKLPLAQLLTTQNRGVGLNMDPHEESNS